MSNPVQQSGLVTPTHLATWTTDGVLQDGGVPIPALSAILGSGVQQINFNSANTDTPISIGLPSGYTRYRVDKILISGATASLATATCGVFTQANAAGTQVVTSGTTITVTASTSDTNNNMQALSINNQDTMSLIDPVLYFRVQNAQGSAALGNIMVLYEPLP